MTQDEIIMCADASGISLYGMGKDREKFIHYLEAFAKLVAQHEREARAKIADTYCVESLRTVCTVISEQIRARGQA